MWSIIGGIAALVGIAADYFSGKANEKNLRNEMLDAVNAAVDKKISEYEIKEVEIPDSEE